jgi:hypothetical protein
MMPYLVLRRSLERMLASIKWDRKCVRVNDDEGQKTVLLCVGDRGAVVIDEATGEAERATLDEVKNLQTSAEVSGEPVMLMKG